MRVLLTGGAGYIGSHTALVLIQKGYEVLVLDDFSNSSAESIDRVKDLTSAEIKLVEVDLADAQATREALAGEKFDAVIHFAGLKAVGESVAEPTRYYRTNIVATLNLLDLMQERSVTKLVFSSSATVYGDPLTVPIDETHRVGVELTNPYGWSKAMIEQMIRDANAAYPALDAVLLRYFNPIGAHPSGRIGEDPAGIPNNLMPFITQVAVGKRAELSVFGDSYDTVDGTGVRDYIHVMDLAEGHVAALENAPKGVSAYNLGSGDGSSVYEVVRAFEAASGVEIKTKLAEPRPGDVATVVADPSKANAELGWAVTRTLEEACRDSWAWQSANPNGYNV